MKTNKIVRLFFTFGVIALLFLSINLTLLNRNNELDTYKQDIPVGVLETSYELTFENNGSVISNAAGSQTTPEICSDGAEGVIIIWDDTRSRNSDIYGQRINATGDFLWGDNGTAICNTQNPLELHTVSDGTGGVIVVWEDASNVVYAQKVNSTGDPQWNANGVLVYTGINIMDLRICSDEAGGIIASWDCSDTYQVYAQRINSTGDSMWTANGVAAAEALGSKISSRICSDKSGGAIIMWLDNRAGNTYLYAQRINSSGEREWGVGGLKMTASTQTPAWPEIESDGVGGAYLVWSEGNPMSIRVQHVSSSGALTWVFGKEIGYASLYAPNGQAYAKMCSDGAGGVFIIWKDITYKYIHAQRLRSNGNLAWPTSAIDICQLSGAEYSYEISYDGFGGALIVWPDDRSGGWDIYTQAISANGELRWEDDGKLICSATNTQNSPEIIHDEEGGVFITWQDYRNGGWDVYAQRIENEDPTSNSPSNITTSIESAVTINWRLYDDYGSDEYRVIANDTLGDFYVWQNWTSWSNNTALNVAINRTAIGVFEYTIEYRDKGGKFGEPSKVIVTLLSDNLPTSSHPSSISTGTTGSEVIPWTLYDDYGGGQFRVLANDTNGDFYVWRDWASWTNNTPLDVPINRINPGVFNYTIEYYDIYNQFGVLDSVVVTVEESPSPPAPEIPFGDFYLVFTFLGIITLIIFKKRKIDSRN